jgi:hypothetical protein
MAALSDKKSLEKELLFSLVDVEKFDKEVAVFSMLARKALFGSTTQEREIYQKRINKRYHGAIKTLDVEDDERIVFTIRDSDGEYSCALCKLQEEFLDKPYHPVLFSE